MTPRSFFTILIKILGIYLILDSITVIPQFISSLFSIGLGFDKSIETIALYSFLLILTVGIYYIILKYCVFKTDRIIDQLKLDKGFVEETFELNIHRSTVLSIAVIVIGGLIFVDSLPTFCKEVFDFIGQKQSLDSNSLHDLLFARSMRSRNMARSTQQYSQWDPSRLSNGLRFVGRPLRMTTIMLRKRE